MYILIEQPWRSTRPDMSDETKSFIHYRGDRAVYWPFTWMVWANIYTLGDVHKCH